MGKHGNVLSRSTHPMVRLYYRRYATSEIEEAPILLEAPKEEKKERVKRRVVLLYPPNCTLCGTCVDLCHWKALKIKNGSLMVVAKLCRGCGLCVKKCANEVLGLEAKG